MFETDGFSFVSDILVDVVDDVRDQKMKEKRIGDESSTVSQILARSSTSSERGDKVRRALGEDSCNVVCAVADGLRGAEWMEVEVKLQRGSGRKVEATCQDSSVPVRDWPLDQ